VGQGRQDGKLYILQARPETVKSQRGKVEQRYKLKGDRSKHVVLAEGRAIGQKIGTGPVRWCAARPRWTACSPATCSSPT
jgi:pyruvate,water dikinase